MTSNNIKESSLITFCIATLGYGGVGKNRLTLSNKLLEEGYRVNFIMAKTSSPYLNKLNTHISTFKLTTSHSIFALPQLSHYIKKEKPSVIFTERNRINKLTLRARYISRSKTTIFSTLHGDLSSKYNMLPDKKKKKFTLDMLKYYAQNDKIIPVSKGIEKDLIYNWGFQAKDIFTIYNPVLTENFYEKMNEDIYHPWHEEKNIPVIISVGRLEYQKDYTTLIKAFAQARQQVKCRLLILGEGKEREKLIQLIKDLNLEKDIDLPGFVENPYPYIKKSDLFVLSSLWEGLPTVLIEALATGTPVIATNCPYGPDEILEDGLLGRLVPVQNIDSLSQAIVESLQREAGKNEVPFEKLEKYTSGYAAKRYVELIEEYLK